MKQILRGVYPALPTPFDRGEEVVLSDLKNMVDFAVKCGVQGIVLNEFFSEFYLFTDKERRETVETVCAHAQGKIPVIVGVSAPTPMRAVYWAEHAQAAGAAAVLCAGPYFVPYLWPDLVDRGFRVMDQKLSIPVIAQNAPPDTLTANLNAGLSREGVKFLLREFERVLYYREDANGAQAEISKFLAAVEDLPPGACLGLFTGAVNGFDLHHDYLRGAAGFMPPLHMADYREKQWRLLEEGGHDRSLAMQLALSPLICFERLYQTEVCLDVLKRRRVIENTGRRRANMNVYGATAREEFQRIYDYLTAGEMV
ncbi:MAG: dihydrodipicolinate synthase family protein [Gracilibacteraceae bacterium]|jgi:4-hydroxy-tetrahydrodipicolinate synthase|nr:dihydrodipicolinate synthase family protein [Gracilibacteraceae bacterium]